MTDIFLYGSLRHLPLLQTVLGRDVPADTLRPATLADHAVHWAGTESGTASWPMILPQPGAVAEGLLLSGAGDDDIARLEFYEGGFGYSLRDVTVTAAGADLAARLWWPDTPASPGAPWLLTDWEARWGRISVHAAWEAMGWYGRLTPQELARQFHGIRLRATSRAALEQRPAEGGHDVTRDVQVVDRRQAYLQFYAVQEAHLRFRRHDGEMGDVLARSCFATGAAIVVLPYDPVRDTVLLVEQFRAPLFLAGDPAPWLWEPIAGFIDPGEQPDQTAHREAMEEAGLRLRGLEKVGEAYSSSGSSTEYVHLYVGLADLEGADGVGGLESEGEDIRSRVLSFEELMAGIDSQSFRDMPLMITALWLARERDRLRQGR